MSPPASTMSAPSPTKMKSYTTARGIWRRTSEVEILSVFDTRIAAFPIGFLSTCGDNTWHYILFVISLCVDPDSLHPGQLVDDQGEPINLGSIPSAGTYRYLETGKTAEVTFARGPEYFSRYVAPSGMEGTTVSASSQASRSRPDQSLFREHLIARDGSCLISDEVVGQCDAAHIVPQSRPDVYLELLGDDSGMFDVSAGLLLSKMAHHSFDALKWSLYKKGDYYYVHYFNPDNIAYRRYNGKAIHISRFRTPVGQPDTSPDPVLIAWHYKQTVLARIRGFSVGMC